MFNYSMLKILFLRKIKSKDIIKNKNKNKNKFKNNNTGSWWAEKVAIVGGQRGGLLGFVRRRWLSLPPRRDGRKSTNRRPKTAIPESTSQKRLPRVEILKSTSHNWHLKSDVPDSTSQNRSPRIDISKETSHN